MSNILCVYYSRTGITAQLGEELANLLQCDALRINDFDNYDGIQGFVKGSVKALTGQLPDLYPYTTDKALEDYDHIIVLAPIWAETVCPIAKSFLQKLNGNYIGEVSYVITHMSDASYRGAIKGLNKYLGKDSRFALSLSTKSADNRESLQVFALNFR